MPCSAHEGELGMRVMARISIPVEAGNRQWGPTETDARNGEAMESRSHVLYDVRWQEDRLHGPRHGRQLSDTGFR